MKLGKPRWSLRLMRQNVCIYPKVPQLYGMTLPCSLFIWGQLNVVQRQNEIMHQLQCHVGRNYKSLWTNDPQTSWDSNSIRELFLPSVEL